jgi:hypothetical protein
MRSQAVRQKSLKHLISGILRAAVEGACSGFASEGGRTTTVGVAGGGLADQEEGQGGQGKEEGYETPLKSPQAMYPLQQQPSRAMWVIVKEPTSERVAGRVLPHRSTHVKA